MQNLNRKWDILCIGGASGTGKTSVGKLLSRYYGVDLVRVDDFQVLLEAVTTPKHLPPVHYWNTHPDWESEGVDATVSQLIDVGRLLTPGLIAVIHDHIGENIPMILEGDFILPELYTFDPGQNIRAVFLFEPFLEQIVQNFYQREGSLQQYRAEVSHAYGKWLADGCAAHGIAVIESRPWDTLLKRVIEFLT